MARQSTGGEVEKKTTRGTSYGLRFRVPGKRQLVHLGYADDGWTRTKAEDELAYTLAQVRRGTPMGTSGVPIDHAEHDAAQNDDGLVWELADGVCLVLDRSR